MVAYSELQTYSAFSFLHGASQPKELVEQAHELGLQALALTDLDGVYGLPRAFQAICNLEKSTHESAAGGLKLISGAVLSLDEGDLEANSDSISQGICPQLVRALAPRSALNNLPRLTLLARNRTGYGLLCRLLTASHQDRPKASASLAWKEFLRILESEPSASLEGLVVLPHLYDEVLALPVSKLSTPQITIQEYLKTIQRLFGERFFLPIHRYSDGHDAKREEWVRVLMRDLGAQPVATQGAHFHNAQRKRLCDVMHGIRQGIRLDQAAGKLFSNAERVLKSPEQMMTLFSDWTSVVEKSVEIAQSCHFSLKELRYRYPSEWIPKGLSAQQYLEQRTWAGAQRRYPGGVPSEVRKQLEHELHLVCELGFSDYFLTIDEIVEFARSRDILCQGRGSAANSAICYCLGITAVDPVRMDLLFERFISAERGEPPDIDVDFEHDRREEVIQHIYNKYGRDRAGMVAAVITYRRRSARREIAKVFGVEEGKAKEFCEQNPNAKALHSELQGMPRHLSIHSGGFTLSADPLIETVPIEPARMEGRTIVQWDKDDLACIGLLKVDVLALGILSALHRCMTLVYRQPELGAAEMLARIPAEDPATYAMMQRADTVGTFQIESRAQMGMLGRLLPRSFYDLVIQVAIVRPGPIVGQMVHPYLRRRRGLEPATAPHPRLERILGRTLGVPLFQEQVMKIAVEMAGFSAGEADELRRAMGTWKGSGTLEKMGQKLMAGLLKSGLSIDYVERIFAQIRGFAEYGFPESHAASFALLAYASAYLKCHAPAEYLIAVLNSLPMGFYSAHTLIDDAKRHGVEVLPVSPEHSMLECSLEPSPTGGSIGGNAVRLGFCLISGASRQQAEEIIKARQKKRFHSIDDFLGRTHLSLRLLLELARGDFFRCFGVEQREAFWRILGAYALRVGARNSAQLSLFSETYLTPSSAVSTQAKSVSCEEGVSSEERGHRRLAADVEQHGGEQVRFDGLSSLEAMEADYRVYSCSTRGHPMQVLRSQFPEVIPKANSSVVRQYPSGRRIRVVGLVIVRQRPGTAKGTTFATLEDESGFLDLILHLSVFERYQDVFLSHQLLCIEGRLQRDLHAVSVIVRKVMPVDLEKGQQLREISSRDFH